MAKYKVIFNLRCENGVVYNKEGNKIVTDFKIIWEE